MSRAKNESGSAVVIAVIVTSIMLSLGLATLALVDGAQTQAGKDRLRETSFNVAEAALNSQTFTLSDSWPSTSAKAYPATCSSALTVANCPNPAAISSAFTGTDFTKQAGTWTVQVRDDLGANPTFYDKTTLDTTACESLVPCTWDSNGNGQVWVRASSTVGGTVRTIVALAKQQRTRLTIPRNVVTSRTFVTTNNGNKIIVDEQGCSNQGGVVDNCNATQPAPISVRCTTTTPATSSDSCLGFTSSQVSPLNYTMSAPARALPTTATSQMRTYAIQQSSYYTSCPTAAQLTGKMVFIDGVSCTFTGVTANSPTSPGVVVIDRGSITFGGNSQYFGLVYATNGLSPPADAGAFVTLSGSAYIQGAVMVEGNGGVVAGSSGLNISFDERAITNVLAAGGSAAVDQSSFRELPSTK